MSVQSEDVTRARFTKGLLLTWVPFVLFTIPMVVNTFGGISRSKATGVGAVAGGISEGLVTFGLAGMVISQALAIVLLARSFDKGHALRSLFSAVSICSSLLLISFMAVVVWLLVRYPR